jgi:hypothetical protein
MTKAPPTKSAESLDQKTLDEARGYGGLVPIVVWPDGRVEQGLGDTIGCFI